MTTPEPTLSSSVQAATTTARTHGQSPAVFATAPLFISEATVKTHIDHVLAKTGSRDRASLVGYAPRTGRDSA